MKRPFVPRFSWSEGGKEGAERLSLTDDVGGESFSSVSLELAAAIPKTANKLYRELLLCLR